MASILGAIIEAENGNAIPDTADILPAQRSCMFCELPACICATCASNENKRTAAPLHEANRSLTVQLRTEREAHRETQLAFAGYKARFDRMSLHVADAWVNGPDELRIAINETIRAFGWTGEEALSS